MAAANASADQLPASVMITSCFMRAYSIVARLLYSTVQYSKSSGTRELHAVIVVQNTVSYLWLLLLRRQPLHQHTHGEQGHAASEGQVSGEGQDPEGIEVLHNVSTRTFSYALVACFYGVLLEQ